MARYEGNTNRFAQVKLPEKDSAPEWSDMNIMRILVELSMKNKSEISTKKAKKRKYKKYIEFKLPLDI